VKVQGAQKMHFTLSEAFLAALIVAYIFSGGVFIVSQKQGHTFIASFDKSVGLGCLLFFFGCCLDTVVFCGVGLICI
jgi:hypothetical protein